MAKTYKGSLTLDWYNKQKSILLTDNPNDSDVRAPTINWVNKDEALFYEVDEAEGLGLRPYWVSREDIRVKEARPLIIQKTLRAVKVDKPGTLPGTNQSYEIQESASDDSEVSNFLVKGDNLLALKSIYKLLQMRGEDAKVKCVFIDPPYNTGKAFVQYDDNLELSQWLTLMRDRIEILYDILEDDGFIWITLDDKGVFHCKLLLDDIFGRNNFVGNVIWQHSIQGKGYGGKFSVHHNYVLCYKKDEEVKLGQAERQDEHNASYGNPDNDPKGDWRTGDLRNSLYRKNLIYDVVTPSGKIISPPANGWRYKEATLKDKIQTGEIVFSQDETRMIRKIYLADQDGRVPETIWFKQELDTNPETIWFGKEVGTTRAADTELQKLFGKDVFDTPKPEALIKKILHLCTEKGDTVLDCFGGSGTTFAVAQKMEREWIGVELGNQADDVIVPRLCKVLEGEQGGISASVGWSGGGAFKVYKLGPSILATGDNSLPDFNWQLSKDFIEESFLFSYDYTLVTETDFLGTNLFPDSETTPKIGVQRIGSKVRVAVVSLNAPDGPQPTISYDELRTLYAALKRKFAPQYINIFTNRGIELAYDSKPDDLEVIKIPHAIFAELEK
jgi:adenine-specific DNA-methyltransferase